VSAAVDAVLDAAPALTAARLARDLVATLPAGALLVLGSSTPVRDVDRLPGAPPGAAGVGHPRGAGPPRRRGARWPGSPCPGRGGPCWPTAAWPASTGRSPPRSAPRWRTRGPAG